MNESASRNIEHFFEDYVPDSVEEYGPIPVEASEVAEFANQFGAGSWSSEETLAEDNGSQRDIASEWLVIGLMMRLFVQHFLSSVASIASPGVDEIRWEKPVRVGDALRIRVTVMEVRRSTSKPDRGMMRAFIETLNQNGEVVLTLKCMNLIRCREATSSHC